MKKISVFAVVVVLMSAGSAFSQNIQFGLLASGDVVAGQVEFQSKQSYGTIAVGGSINYHDEDYTIGDAHIALKSDPLIPGLRYSLGFKGLYGEVDEEDRLNEGTLAALGFLLGIDYELTSAINPVNIPVEVYGGACFAPGSLSFEDAERYQEYKGGIRFYVLESAFIGLEVLHRDIKFDTHGREWSRDDTVFTAGVTLRL